MVGNKLLNFAGLLANLISFSIASPGQLSSTEYLALESLYNSTNGDNWIWKTPYELNGIPWNFTHGSDPCSNNWQGLTCSECVLTECFVQVIKLDSTNLTGTLPQSMGNLELLNILMLSSNNIGGSIPESIYQLVDMQTLDLSSNYITGTISSQIGNMPLLYEYFLSSNPISGPIPPSICDGTMLSYLIIANTALNGSLPETIGDCTSLIELDFEGTDIGGTIPASIGNLTQLEYLIFEDTLLTGTLPPELGHMLLLKEIAGSGVAISGTLPPEMFAICHFLETFDLGTTLLTGSLPAAMGNCEKMIVLDITYCLLTGAIPASFGNMRTMVEWSAANTLMSGSLPESIGNWTMLTTLTMGYSLFTGPLPATLNNWGAAAYLDFRYNMFSGPLPFTEDTLIKACYYLALSSNLFTGTLPAAVANLTELSVLDLDYNLLTGTLPDAVFSLPLLQIFEVDTNLISGTFPAAIAQALMLVTLHLQDNLMTGTLPDIFASLPQMTDFDLSTNFFSGTIPHSICEMRNVVDILCGYNLLNGTLPACISTMVGVDFFEFQYNFITGTLPNDVGNMHSIIGFSASDNRMTGTIPASFGDILTLNELLLDNNFFTGTLASQLLDAPILGGLLLNNNLLTGSLPNVTRTTRFTESLDFYANSFTGTIPESFWHFPGLENININQNMITGTISPYLAGNWTALEGLSYGSNFLTGSLPSEFASFYLRDVSIDSNFISGAIPEQLGTIQNLSQVFMGNNLLTGTIPPTMTNLQNLSILSLETNFLTGSLPSDYTDSMKLVRLNVSSNRLSGSIPYAIGSALQLQYIDLSNNSLTGAAPTSLGYLQGLREVFLDNNKFSGSLEGVFDGRSQGNLTTIDLSFNQFSGTIPASIFHSERLLTFTAVSNCFTGTLPDEICSSTALTVLALDGASAAPACQTIFFPRTSISTYYLTSSISGTIPACYLSIASLQTLHLSGNGLTGTLPKTGSIGNLSDLSLSNNALSGTIPAAFQSARYANLDLAYNRFTGILSADIAVAQDNSSLLSLEVNRLSGDIPSSLKSLSQIDILDGNMFTCSPDKSSLPRSDSSYGEYECGSNTFNTSIYLWIAVVAIAMICAGAVWSYGSDNVTFIQWARSYLEALRATHIDNLKHLLELNNLLRSRGVLFIAVVAVALLVVYGVFTLFYHTYQFEYAWTLSAAYLSGLVVGVVLLVLFTALLLPIVLWVGVQEQAQTSSAFDDALDVGSFTSRVTEQQAKSERSFRSLERLVKMASIALMSFTATVVVNASYVYIVINFSSSIGTLMQIAVALYKLLWNRIVVPKILIMLTKDGRATSPTIMFLFLMELFNNIIAPCVATAVISSNCFYNVFVLPPSVDSTYSYQACSDVDVLNSKCLEYTTLSSTASYTPPFYYSYQCSSTLIKEYAPVYVYMFLFVAFGKPLLLSLLEYVVEKVACLSALRFILPPINRPVGGGSQSLSIGPHFVVFDKAMFLLTVYTHIAVLLTFGVVFPPLCFVIALSLVSHTYYTEFTVGRVLVRARELSVSEQFADLLSQNARKLLFTVSPALLIMVRFAAFFYSLFVFDILGDALGWRKALPAMVVMIVVPYVLQAGVWLWLRRKGDNMPAPSVDIAAGDVERSSARTASVPYTVYGSSVDHISKQHAAFQKNPMAPTAVRGENDL